MFIAAQSSLDLAPVKALIDQASCCREMAGNMTRETNGLPKICGSWTSNFSDSTAADTIVNVYVRRTCYIGQTLCACFTALSYSVVRSARAGL